MNYLDFDLEINEMTGELFAVSARSPAGEARGTTPFALDLQSLDLPLTGLRSMLRQAVPSDAGGESGSRRGAVRTLGTTLFEAALTGGIAERYRESLGKAREQEVGLRLVLRIQAPRLAALPWEFMFDPREERFLCLSAETPIVRYPELPRAPEVIAVDFPLRVLAVIATPNDLPELDKDAERARVERAISPLIASRQVELTWIGRGTYDALQAEVWKRPYHIVHFIGHGGFDETAKQGYVALEAEDGSRTPLFANELNQVLSGSPGLRLVVLNSCKGGRSGSADVFSSTAATLVHGGIPAVVAMQYEISDRAAIEFARVFYGRIADRLPIDVAVTAARGALSFTDRDSVEWGTPVLFMRSPNGQLFKWSGSASEVRDAPTSPPSAQPPARDRRLVITFKALPLEVHCCFARTATIGRSLDCDFALPRAPQSLSGLHATISYDQETKQFGVTDLDSRNGTFVNGQRIEQPAVLEAGARLNLSQALAFTIEVVGGKDPAVALVHRGQDGRELTRLVLVAGDTVGVGTGLTDLVRPPRAHDGRSAGTIRREGSVFTYSPATDRGKSRVIQDVEAEVPVLNVVARMRSRE